MRFKVGFIVVIFIFGIFLVGCGSDNSDAGNELDLERESLAISDAKSMTATPLPTNIPESTNTPEPTPTPEPIPYALKVNHFIDNEYDGYYILLKDDF